MRLKQLFNPLSESDDFLTVVPDAEPIAIPAEVEGCKFKKISNDLAFIIQQKGQLRYAFHWKSIPDQTASQDTIKKAVIDVFKKLQNLFPESEYPNLSFIAIGGQLTSAHVIKMIRSIENNSRANGIFAHIDPMGLGIIPYEADLYMSRKDFLHTYFYMPNAPAMQPYTPLQTAKKSNTTSKRLSATPAQKGSSKKKSIKNRLDF